MKLIRFEGHDTIFSDDLQIICFFNVDEIDVIYAGSSTLTRALNHGTSAVMLSVSLYKPLVMT